MSIRKSGIAVVMGRTVAVAGGTAWLIIGGSIPLPSVPASSVAAIMAATGPTLIVTLMVTLPGALIAHLLGGVQRGLTRVVAGGPTQPGQATALWAWALLAPIPVIYFGARPQLALRYDLVEDVTLMLALGVGGGLAWLLHLLLPRRWPRLPRLDAAGPAVLLAVVLVWMWVGPLPRVAPRWSTVTLIPALLGVSVALATLSHRLSTPWQRAAIGLGWAGALAATISGAVRPPQDALRHPVGAASLEMVRVLADRDGDGFSALWGGGDCDDERSDVNPLAIEIAGNGRDDNCMAGDLSRIEAPLPATHPIHADIAHAPDVVIISVDALRADHLTAALMPNLAAFTQTTRAFTQAYSAAPLTDLSLRSIFTGWPPSDFDYRGQLVGMDSSIAEVLGQAGWRCFALHSVPDLGQLILHGFHRVNNQLAERHRHRAGVSAPEITAAALSLLQAPRSAPRLLWVHYFEPHHRYIPHPGFEHHGDDLAGLYRQEVAFTDRAMGPLLDWLERSEVAARTVVILFADHGEYLGERGKLGHDYSLYEPVLRVPLLIRGPATQAARIDVAVSLVDVFPTILDLAGVQGVEPRAGRSLAQHAAPRPLLAEGRRSVGDRSFVALHWRRHLLHCAEARHDCELFDLSRDPASLYDISGDQPAMRAALQSHLETQLDGYRNDIRITARKAAWVSRMRGRR